MPPAQHAQPSPSFKVALGSDHHKTILPNLSYPSRLNEHIPWSGSSAPLVFRKTMRREMTITTITPNTQAPSSVPDVFHAIGVLVRHNLSVIIRKLQSIKQRLAGVRATSLSGTASV